jgi:hypothetical protein
MDFLFDNLINFLYKMILLVVGHQYLTITLKIFIHMNHVLTAPIFIIVLVIVHLGDNFLILYMSNVCNINISTSNLFLLL